MARGRWSARAATEIQRAEAAAPDRCCPRREKAGSEAWWVRPSQGRASGRGEPSTMARPILPSAP
eukprot:1629253-Alexandrium_andersonii.AAC.1